jgi:ubiquinone/menaquinone biosynthesis C-methylase UbiE
MINKTEGWKKRNVRYEEIHNVNPFDMQKLVESLEIQNANRIADLMCGYGAVTREILNYCKETGISVNPVLIDLFSEQLNKSYEELKGNNITRIIADVREKCLEHNSIDRAVIKMGVHEVPKKDQQIIIDNVYNSLKLGGIFSMWDVMPSTEEQQILFQDIIRKKDELAGFDSLTKNRYFFRLDEAISYLTKAGFKDVEHIHKIEYKFSSEKRLQPEFNGKEEKLVQWNDYIRNRVPEHLKEKLRYEDKGRTIDMAFTKGIVRGKK